VIAAAAAAAAPDIAIVYNTGELQQIRSTGA